MVFKVVMLVILGTLLLNSEISLGANTAEKWLCSRDGLERTIRLAAPSKGTAPCKVYFSKRTQEDPNDVATEAAQDDGTIKPIYYSTGNGGFCVRKMDDFREDKEAHRWVCSKL